MTRLRLSSALALSLSLAAGCATGEAPAGPATTGNGPHDFAGEPPIVLDLDDPTGALDRFEAVFVDAEIWVDHEPADEPVSPAHRADVFELRAPDLGFGAHVELDLGSATAVRVRVAAAFGIAFGVSEDLPIEPFELVAEVIDGRAQISIPLR